MLFNEFDFWLFFSVVFVLYLIVKPCARSYVLLFGSYFFYASWELKLLSLLMVSTFVDYYCGLKAYRFKRNRSFYLKLSIFTNLTVLGIFKYFNFFTESFLTLFQITDSQLNYYLAYGVPVGISFYTFQSMSYTIDCYRRRIKPTKKIVDLALYVSFFPQLLAGPIERSFRLLPQIQKLSPPSLLRMSDGLCLIAIGLFRKLFVADSLFIPIQYMSHEKEILGPEVLMLGLLMFFALYFDFSAYSNIARGLAKFFNIDLIVNFRAFYFTRSPSHFWKNWHISLTEWIKDYFFKPLIKSNFGQKHAYFCRYTVFILIAFWHDATLSWLLFGLVAGFFDLVFQVLSRSYIISHVPSLLRIFSAYFTMFIMYTVLGSLLLLGDTYSLEAYLDSFTKWESSGEALNILNYSYFYLVPMIVYDYFSWHLKVDNLLGSLGTNMRILMLCLIFASLVFLVQGKTIPFIYYKF